MKSLEQILGDPFFLINSLAPSVDLEFIQTMRIDYQWTILRRIQYSHYPSHLVKVYFNLPLTFKMQPGRIY